jgi:hypothetical protein
MKFYQNYKNIIAAYKLCCKLENVKFTTQFLGSNKFEVP